MKISYMSDIHLDFTVNALDNINNESNSDVLIIAGDLIQYNNLNNHIAFFENISKKWNDIIIILGNHDSYHGVITESYIRYKAFLQEFPNITLLQNSFIDIGDIRFVGTTLWTDYFGSNYSVMEYSRYGLNDHRLIKMSHGGRNFLPDDALYECKKAQEYITNPEVLDHTNIVLITHHSPTLQSIVIEYQGDPLNGAYASDFDYIYTNNPQIKVSIHGHMHSKLDYKIGETRILCNPRGYPSERVHRIFKIQDFKLSRTP